MTRSAIHKKTGKLVSPEEFVALEGAQYREKGVYPSCPSCGADLSPYGVHSVTVTSRFDHPNGSNCSLSSTPDPRYAHLSPSEWDMEAGGRLRAAMCEIENLKSVYSACRSLTSTLSGHEFVEMCRQADRRNVWCYKGLTLDWLPYILVTLVDLPATDKRSYPLRIVLIKKRRDSTIDSLWITPEDCSLQRHFADTGRPMRSPPTSIPCPDAEKAKGDTSWISQKLLDIITECCLHHA